MATVTTEGNNTVHTQSPKARETERKAERGWPFQHAEPWSPERERVLSMEVVTAAGSMIEATGGFVAIILAILSFARVRPFI